MKAMVLAAGFGTRLGEKGKKSPKCLMEAGGKTMLEHVLNNLKRAGVREVIINLHHLGDQVEAYVKTNVRDVKVEFSREEVILGTGGGLKNAHTIFSGEEDFFMHNSDVYSDFDLQKLLDFHRSRKAIASLAVMNRKTSRPLVIDAHSAIIGWRSERTNESVLLRAGGLQKEVAFSGIQVISPRLFNYMSEQSGEFSIISTYMKAAAQGEAVLACDMSDAFWIDVGTPEKLEELRERLKILTPPLTHQ